MVLCGMNRSYFSWLTASVLIFYLCGNCANEWHLSSGTWDIWRLTPNTWKIVTFNTTAFYSLSYKKCVACLFCSLNLFLFSWTITQLLQLSSPLISFLFLCLSSLLSSVSHISVSLFLLWLLFSNRSKAVPGQMQFWCSLHNSMFLRPRKIAFCFFFLSSSVLVVSWHQTKLFAPVWEERHVWDWVLSSCSFWHEIAFVEAVQSALQGKKSIKGTRQC